MDSPVGIGDLLVSGFGASSVRLEGDRVGGTLSDVLQKRLVDRVVEAPGEGLAVLPAGQCDGDWSGLACWHFRLPGAVGLVKCQRLAVQAG